MEAESLIAMPIDEKILTLSDAFQKGRVNGVAYSDMLKLLGDSAAENLLPIITKSREELEALFGEAPEDIASTINELAKMDKILAKSTASLTNWFGKQAAEAVVWGTLIKDFFATGSMDEALVRAGERDDAAIQDLLNEEENARLKAEAIAAARESEAAMVEEAAAAKELESAMQSIAKIREGMANDALEMLPTEERIAALKSQLESFVGEKMAPFGLNFEESISGMEALSASREARGGLPATGVNSSLEVFEWLEAAKEMVAEIGKLEEDIAKDLETLRAGAEADAFRLMSPEEQAANLRGQLSASLGVDVGKAADIEAGLERLREEARQARESGDTAAEMAALERLNAAQDQADQLGELATRSEDAMSQEPEAEMGSVAALFKQLFGEDPEREQAESLRTIQDESRKQREVLDKILVKMDEPPEPVRFTNF